MNTMKTTIPKKNPIIVERIGFVDTNGPSNLVTLIPNNAAIRNSRGRATINRI